MMRALATFSLAAVLLACGDDDPAPADGGIDAGHDAGTDAGPPPDRVVLACDEVVIGGEGARGRTEVGGWPLLDATPRDGDLVFRAPGVARPTLLFVADLVVRVDPRGTDAFDIPGLASDCGRFAHGVASGEPRPDGVTLWTRWTPEAAATSASLDWVIATDRALETVVASGSATTGPDDDWTVHVDVAGLAPSTTYYYRFTGEGGEVSVLGRTRTAPEGAVDHLRFATMSCSSLFSGYFSAYRRIAERDDLDLVIHLGDYIYDFVDENERVRVPPSGEVEDLVDLASHRRRHAEYLSDPDLRLARQAHPWVVLWDNHDLSSRAPPDYAGGAQAFREWTPIPSPAGTTSDRIYRVLRFGELVDLVVVDMLLFQGREVLPGGTSPAVLGAEQEAWLEGELRASSATWRVIGMQKVFAEFGPLSGWQDFADARSRLISFFEREGIGDNVFLSGDSHFTVWQDVADRPTDDAAPYDPATGAGAIGAEFLATSISRGNFDEQLGATATRLIDGTRRTFLRDNPHQVDLELTSHGYGLVDIRPEQVVTEVWYSPILSPADAETFGGAYAVRRGQNRFDRSRIDAPTAR